MDQPSVRQASLDSCQTFVQLDRLQKAADDARQQLESKENIVKELSRDGSKLDKERYADVFSSDT